MGLVMMVGLMLGPLPIRQVAASTTIQLIQSASGLAAPGVSGYGPATAAEQTISTAVRPYACLPFPNCAAATQLDGAMSNAVAVVRPLSISAVASTVVLPNVATGHLVVVVTTGADPTTAITDTLGSTYHSADSWSVQGNGSQPANTSVFYATTLASGGDQILVNKISYWGTTANTLVWAGEYAGVDPNFPLRGVSSGAQSSTKDASGATVASASLPVSPAAQPGDLLLGVLNTQDNRFDSCSAQDYGGWIAGGGFALRGRTSTQYQNFNLPDGSLADSGSICHMIEDGIVGPQVATFAPASPYIWPATVAVAAIAFAPAGTATPIPGVFPSAPTNVQAVNGGDGKATVTWQSPNDPGATVVSTYKINAYQNGSLVTAWVVQASTYGWTATGLTNGKPYTFGVSAGNQAGYGPEASSPPVTPMDIPPAAPVWTNALCNG
ncbi:MAG: fibronectin type III domain-containing protein, partial [Candidatus Dormibacteria bacterium]